MTKRDDRVGVMDVPMFAPITTGTAYASGNAPEPTIATTVLVVTDEL